MSTPLTALQESAEPVDPLTQTVDPEQRLRAWLKEQKDKHKDKPEDVAILLGFPAPRQWLLRASTDTSLLELIDWLSGQGCFLVTLVATDERDLVEQGYKLTYLFSYPGRLSNLSSALQSDDFAVDNLLVFVEQPIGDAETFQSIQAKFQAVIPFQQHMIDMFGLCPKFDLSFMKSTNNIADPEKCPEPAEDMAHSGEWLHPHCYPSLDSHYPLRRLGPAGGPVSARQLETVPQQATQPESSPVEANAPVVNRRPGEWLLEVGPIHAGIIEPGRFEFRLAGEIIEELTIHLGYTHKGIEECFQARRTLENGWELAERVAGDSSFAHSLAYCQAVEALAGLRMPPEADNLRALCLELERIAAHIGDCAAMAHDVAFNLPASELARKREKMLQINQRLFGSRLLRGLNRPGAIILPTNPSRETLKKIRDEVQELVSSFDGWADGLVHNPSFYGRLKWTGILPESEAACIGATGLVARASGILRDFRLLHPFGLYRNNPEVRKMILDELPLGSQGESREATAGDALARFLMRQREVRSSRRIVDYVFGWWEKHVDLIEQYGGSSTLARNHKEMEFPADKGKDIIVHALTHWPVQWHKVPNNIFGVGCVEGWRGDIVYWVMKNKLGRIFRCQPRDPSLLNWPALEATINLRKLNRTYIDLHEPPFEYVETSLADFPIINKSFNLSYSGRDL